MKNLPVDFYRYACENVPYGVAAITENGKFIWANSYFCSVTGYSLTELQDKKWADITVSEDVGSDSKEMSKVLSGEINSYTLQKEYIKKNGARVSVVINVRKLPSDSDVIIVAFTGIDMNTNDIIVELQSTVSELQKHLSLMDSTAWFSGMAGKTVKAYWWIISGVFTAIGAVIGWIISILT